MDLENDCTDPVPLPNLTGSILKMVIDWAIHYKEVTKNMGKYEIDIWDRKFFNLDPNTMYDLILAANYLDIKDLMDVSTQMVADSPKGPSLNHVDDKGGGDLPKNHISK